MSQDESLEPHEDGMHPPAIPTEVFCLHCQEVYESYLIEWRVSRTHDGRQHGFWCCPTPGCGGAGFGCDIFPTDPEHQNDRGIVWCSDDDDEEVDDEDFDEIDDLPEETNSHANRSPDDDSDVPF